MKIAQNYAQVGLSLPLPSFARLLGDIRDLWIQGFQLSRIERESPAWTLFLPLSCQACKISCINEKKNPAKHIKSPSSVGENP